MTSTTHIWLKCIHYQWTPSSNTYLYINRILTIAEIQFPRTNLNFKLSHLPPSLSNPFIHNISNIPLIFKFQTFKSPASFKSFHPRHTHSITELYAIVSSSFPSTGHTYTSYLSSTDGITVALPLLTSPSRTQTYFTLQRINTAASLAETWLGAARKAALFWRKGPSKNTYGRGPFQYPDPPPKIYKAGALSTPPISPTFPLYQTSRRL